MRLLTGLWARVPTQNATSIKSTLFVESVTEKKATSAAAGTLGALHHALPRRLSREIRTLAPEPRSEKKTALSRHDSRSVHAALQQTMLKTIVQL